MYSPEVGLFLVILRTSPAFAPIAWRLDLKTLSVEVDKAGCDTALGVFVFLRLRLFRVLELRYGQRY